jgi:hypothetical protein
VITVTYSEPDGWSDVHRDGGYLGSIENVPAGSSEWVVSDPWGGVSPLTTDFDGALLELGVTEHELAEMDDAAVGFDPLTVPEVGKFCSGCRRVIAAGVRAYSDSDESVYCGECAANAGARR